MKSVLIVLLGPTGVGKTELSLRVAEHFRIPIINADSRQLFCEIPIGTAAPTVEQQARVKHYFVGTHRLTDYYSAAMFEEDVLALADKLSAEATSLDESDQSFQRFQYGVPFALLTGGSMLYIDAVCKGIDDIPTVRDDIRNAVKLRYEREGLAPLLEQLKALDPEHYEMVDRQNPRRVIHAVEICLQTGRTYTSFRVGKKKNRPFDILKIGLQRNREELYDRINRRVDNMMANGWLDEAHRVYPMRQLNALNTVGYKELFSYFDGTWTLDEAVERIKGNTRRYMRKQMTWFKRDSDIRWYHPQQETEIIDDIARYLDNGKD